MKENALVFLPVYNEKQYIKPVINEITETLKKLEKEHERTYDILVVNDNSDSELLGMLKDIAKENTKLSIANHGINKGLAAAIKTGFDYSLDNGYDIVMRTDCDLEQLHSDMLMKLNNADRNFDVVVGRRHIQFPENSLEGKTTYKRTMELNEKFGLDLVEPSSGNHRSYRKILEKVVDTDYYQDYSRRWGLDTVLVVLAKKLGGDIGYVDVEGRYEPDRRPDEKVITQDRIRKEIIAELYDLKV